MAILKTLPDLIAAFNHNALLGLGSDDHPQYMLVDGTRAFTGVVEGVTPTSAAHLTTKQYVDDLVAAIDHASLSGLLDDDHTQYHNDARADLWLTTKTTDDISEGANLYYTEARVSANADVIAALAHTSLTNNPHTTTLTQVLAADGGTTATTANIEELTNGSEITLHTHAQPEHGDLVGLADDDHTQYHNDVRGDARYYTKTLLDTGQLDSRYYTQALLDGGQLDNRYYTEAEVDALLDAGSISFDPSGNSFTSVNVQDTLAEAAGRLDTLESAPSVDHGDLTGLLDDDHTQYPLVDGTRGFTGVVAGITPTLASHLATKGYVDTEISSLTTDHGGLTGLADDDHTQYTLADGTRAFTGVVEGVTPTLSAHLATKGYVDTEISSLTTDHGSLVGLSDDDHTQYILVDGTRSFSAAVGGVTPTLGAHLATKDYVDTLVNGISWQEPVLDRNRVAAPGSATAGDRYIIAGTGGGWSGFTINDIVEYDGSSWNNVTPVEGVAVFVEDEDVQYVFNDSNTWVRLSSTINHSNLTNLTADVHTQYLLANGTRNLTGNLSVDALITIDGRDISEDGAILDSLSNDFANHIATGLDRHGAVDISFSPNGDIAATTVQAAIQEVRDDTDTKLGNKVDSVNTQTGVVVLDGADIDSGHTAVNYTAATAIIDNHLAGIDTELGVLAADIAANNIWNEAATIITPVTGTELDMGTNGIIKLETLTNTAGENLIISNTLAGGPLQMRSLGDVIVSLDTDDNNASRFQIRNGTGSNIFSVDEHGDLTIPGTVFCDTITFNGGSAVHSLFTSNGDILLAADQTVPDRNIGLRATNEVRVFTDGDNDSSADNFVVYTGVNSVNSTAEVFRAGPSGLSLKNGRTFELTNGCSFKPSKTAYSVSGTTNGEMIAAVTSTAGITVTLASDDATNGNMIFIKDEGGNAGTNNITINTEGAETIDGVSTVTITADYGVLRLYSDGTNWFSL